MTQRAELKDGGHGIPSVDALMEAYGKDNPADDHAIGCQGVALATVEFQLNKLKDDEGLRKDMPKWLMAGMGKMLGMASVPEWDSLADYLKEPYRDFADQIIKLIGEKG